MQPSSDRIDWVDTCKGIGIAAIVLGHSLPHHAITAFLFLFHVPLFFFVSGFLFRPRVQLAAYLRKKSAHLLLPYLAFVVALAPPLAIHCIRHGGSLQALESLAWGGTEMHGAYAIFWFITCLFFTQQVMNVLLSKLSLRTTTLIVLGFMAVGYLNSLTAHVSLPLDANVALEACPFFLGGYLFRKYGLPKWSSALAAALTITAIALILAGVPISYDMKYGRYGIPVLSFVLAIGCILAVIAISRAITLFPVARRPFMALGSASMGIMYLHEFFLGWLTRVHRIDGEIAFVIALTLSFAATRLLAVLPITNRVFLGEVRHQEPVAITT